MLVLCYGMQKSGSTLAFEIVRGVLQSAGFEQPFVYNDMRDPAEARRNYINNINKENVAALVETIGPDRRIAIKTHANLPNEIFAWVEERQRAREIQIVTSYRDPRDVCLSLLDAGEKSRETNKGAFGTFRTLDEAAEFVEGRVARFRKWSAVRGALRLNYDLVAFEPETAIAAIERALNVRCDKAEVLKHAFDRAYTQKNVAQRHRYLTDMDDEQKRRMGEKFRRFIKHACENDEQAWYDKRRDYILAGREPNV
jgi:hypothetical protein